jgi:hypothetical protein
VIESAERFGHLRAGGVGLIAGVRRSIWVVSAALASLALWIAFGAPTPIQSRAPTPAVEASAQAPPPPVRVGTSAVSAVAAGSGSARRPERASVPPVAPPFDAGAVQLARADSRVAADLRILEDDAARVAESRRLIDPASVDAAVIRSGATPGRTQDDARRALVADAVLVDHFVQDAYRGTEFPIGYPAEERTRAAAESLVRSLSPELRRDTLEALLAMQDDATNPIGPRFAPPESGLVWEGAIR